MSWISKKKNKVEILWIECVSLGIYLFSFAPLWITWSMIFDKLCIQVVFLENFSLWFLISDFSLLIYFLNEVGFVSELGRLHFVKCVLHCILYGELPFFFDVWRSRLKTDKNGNSPALKRTNFTRFLFDSFYCFTSFPSMFQCVF